MDIYIHEIYSQEARGGMNEVIFSNEASTPNKLNTQPDDPIFTNLERGMPCWPLASVTHTKIETFLQQRY